MQEMRETPKGNELQNMPEKIKITEAASGEADSGAVVLVIGESWAPGGGKTPALRSPGVDTAPLIESAPQNEPGVNCYGYLASELNEGDNASEMSPGSSAESYPAFPLNGLRENLFQLTCPNHDLNQGNNNNNISSVDEILLLVLIEENIFLEQVDSFKYLGSTISSNMSCCQEVKRRIAMAKEAFNRKRSVFCGFLEKELRKRLVNCFVWSVALYGAETWTLRRSEEKRIKHLKCGYGEEWSVKNDAETEQEDDKELAGSLAEKKLPTEGCTERNGEREKVWGRGRYEMIDDIKIYGSFAGTKRKAENRKDWRMLGLQ
ncbi:hypothetical protein ANN_21602 [Periplaneta americana]|uniref:Uncharacterized protein n=1 Tax=Periplaneta americana TaxID=6978 RepID=A0ABQ8S5W2_PERAM|nr:hypothetical protein ANN_21602 [Periplaneta americana]